MNTTNLFVELVVIGMGASFWMAMLVLAVFGYQGIPFDQLAQLPALLPALSIVYCLGVLVDRLADVVFNPWAKRLCGKRFGDGGPGGPSAWFKGLEPQERPYLARFWIYHTSPTLKEVYEYSRVRLRICRGWAVNCLLIVLTGNLFLWTRVPAHLDRMRISSFGTLMLLSMAAGAALAWRGLAKTEYRRLEADGTQLMRMAAEAKVAEEKAGERRGGA